MANAGLDQNSRPTLTALSNANDGTIVQLWADPVTHRLLVDLAAGLGTVTSVSVVSANGFAGTVATATTTPAITISTTITGVLKGNGTAISAASAGSDYVAPGAITTSGLTMSTAKILGRATAGTGAIEEIAVTGSGSVVLAVGPTITGHPTVEGVTSTGATGTGKFVFDGTPTLVTPVLGVATATSINGLTLTASTGTLTITNLKTVSFANSIAFAGTDSTTMTFPTTSATLARTDAANTFTGTQTITTIAGLTTVTGAASNMTITAGTGNSRTMILQTTTSGGVATTALTLNADQTATFAAGATFAGATTIGTGNAFTTGTIELGNASDTTLSRSAGGVLAVEGVVIPSISSTNTLTNKRVTRRLTTTNNPGATPTTNTDNVDVMNFTGCANAITSMTTNLSGTPVDGDQIEFRFTDNGTARAITWGASFAATTVPLPTTTVISTMLRVGFEWDGSVWRCVATA